MPHPRPQFSARGWNAQKTGYRLPAADAVFAIGWALSSARFRSSTLTRGSPKKAKLPPGSMRADQALEFILAHAPLPRDARNLEFCRRRRNVRIKARARRRHQIYGHWRTWVLGLQCRYVLL